MRHLAIGLILTCAVVGASSPARTADPVQAEPIQTTAGASQAFVVTSIPDTVLYPTTTARDTYLDAMTEDFKADFASGPLSNQLPRIRSWLGGLLWGTNKLNDGFWIPNQFNSGGGSSTDWTNRNVQTQGALFTDLIVAGYGKNPNLNGVPPIDSNFGPGDTGLRLSRIYPFIAQNAVWDPRVVDAMSDPAKSYWQSHAPLGVFANPQFEDLRLVPVASAPMPDATGVIRNDPSGVLFFPVNLLVDRQGDFDVDFVYQNDDQPYRRSAHDAPGEGQYLKYTVSQASPFVWVEANQIPVLVLRDQIAPAGTNGAIFTGVLAPTPIPQQPNISVALLYANADDPGLAGEPANPKGAQDNWRLWAVYFDNTKARFVNYEGSETGSPSGPKEDASWNSYLAFDDPAAKNFFVIAALPIERSYTSQRIAQAPTQAAQEYATALGPYAFNFPTATAIAYDIVDHSQVGTTFSTSLTPVYGNAQPGSVFALPRHQYEPMSLGRNPASGAEVVNTPLTASPNVIPFNPDDPAPGLATPWEAKYWSVRGSHKAIAVEPEAAASASYETIYPFNNFLHGLPLLGGSPDSMRSTRFQSTLAGVDVTASDSLNSNNLGGFLTAAMDRDFVTNASNAAFNGAWGFNLNNAIGSFYSNQYLMVGLAQDLALIHSLYQAFGDQVPSDFTDATGQSWIGGPPPPFTVDELPSKSTATALDTSVAQLQASLQKWFGSATPPTSNGSPASLQNFLYYDPLGFAIFYPQNGICAAGKNFPNGSNQLNTLSGCDPTGVYEAFGTGTKFTDGAYGIGGWIAAAALTAIYENAAQSAPAASNWAQAANYGAAIDLAVMGIAFDPAVACWFPDPAVFKFSKMPYFDQFAGHSWTTGILGTAPIFQGGNGHNENSVTESGQAFASIILWGMATGRRDVTELGIYLFTTHSFAADYYFFDKTNAYQPAGLNTDRNAAGRFVPLATTGFTGGLDNTTEYPAGAALSEFIATGSAGPGSGNSSINNMDVLALPVATLFGGYPQAHAFIEAATGFPWMLASGRNAEYWHSWNAAFDNDNYRAWSDWPLVKTGKGLGTTVYNYGFAAMMLVNQALGGYGTRLDEAGQTAIAPYPGPANLSSAGVTPLQYYLNLMTLNSTSNPPNPPFDTMFNASQTSALLSDQLGTEAEFAADAIPISVNYSNSHTVASMINLLWTLESLGPPDWTLVGRPLDDGDPYVFTAAFAQRDVSDPAGEQTAKTTCMVFNPNTAPVSVGFFRVDEPDTTVQVIADVPPKSWVVSVCPNLFQEPPAACAPTPLPGCKRTIGHSKGALGLVDVRGHGRDRLRWVWRGEGTTLEEVGDPLTADSLALCLYDQSRGLPETLTFSAAAPAGGTCGKRACWRRFGDKMLRYRDRSGTPDGLTEILLHAGHDRRAKLSVRAEGRNLSLPDLPHALPALIQLQSTSGACWEAEIREPQVLRNTRSHFLARAH